MRAARWFLLACLIMLVAPATSMGAGVNVFIGSATIPTVQDTTILAFPGQGTGDLAAPGITANASVTAFPADAAGGIPGPTIGSGGVAVANLWVDTNGGTCIRQSTAASYNDAAACASFSTAAAASTAGDTVLVKPGTYGSQSITTSRVSTVTIAPEIDATVEIGGLSFSGAQNFDVGGTGMDAPGATIAAISSTNVTARNIHIDARTGTGGTAVFIERSSGVLLYGLTLGPLTRDDAIQIWPYTSGSGFNTNITIDHAYVHDLDSDPSIDHGDCVQAASVDGLVIKNSQFINCYAQGLFINPFTGDAPVKNITIENNFVSTATPSGRPSVGGALNIGDLNTLNGGAGTLLIRNNTIAGDPTIGVSETAATSSASVIGNIFPAILAFSCQTYVGRVDTFAYNVTGNACSGATNNTTSTSSTINAGFVSSGTSDFHLLTGSVARGKGSPTSHPTDDIDGGIRASTPDAGADEFGAP